MLHALSWMELDKADRFYPASWEHASDLKGRLIRALF